MRRIAIPFAVAALVATSLSTSSVRAVGEGSAPVAALTQRAPSDFNGDGWSDLAIGKTRGNGGAGEVFVLYGNQDGLEGSVKSQTLRQGVGGMPGTAAVGDDFGEDVAWGDFNGDGFADLAIGTPNDVVGSIQPGSVTILYGRRTGLDPSKARLFSPGAGGVAGTATDYEVFGTTLAVGDFGYGPQDDLAIDAFGTDFTGAYSAGSVTIMYGTPRGLRPTHSRVLSTATPGVKGSPVNNLYFGREALAAGDFGRTAYDDLAVGGSGETVAGVDRAGALHVFYGSPRGLTVRGDQRFVEGSGGISDLPEVADFFSNGLAAGDFGKTTYDDLAVASSQEDLESPVVSGAGSVFVLYGSPSGLTGKQSRQLWLGSNGLPGTPTAGDFFGTELAAGNLGRTRHAELVIGSPDVGVGGSALVIYGSARGIKTKSAQEWTQNTAGVIDVAEAGDYLGNALAIGNFGFSKTPDLAVGVHSEDFPGFANAGAIHIFYGTPQGLSAIDNHFLYEGGAGFPGALQVSGFTPDALA